MSDLDLALALIGGLILSLGVISDFIKQYVSFLMESLLAVAYGVLIGPAGLGLLRVTAFGDPMGLLEQASRLTLGLAVMGVAPDPTPSPTCSTGQSRADIDSRAGTVVTDGGVATGTATQDDNETLITGPHLSFRSRVA